MSSPWSDLKDAPVVAHTAIALGKILREQLGIGEQQFDVVAHSLGSALAAVLSKAGSPCRPRRTVLIDPVCFLQSWEKTIRLPLFSESESENLINRTRLFDGSPSWVKKFAAKVFRRWIIQDIFTQFAVQRWAGPGFIGVWTDAKSPALVCLADDDQLVDSKEISEHCNAHFPSVTIWRTFGAQHGSFLYEGSQRRALLKRIETYLGSPGKEERDTNDGPQS
jgi:pimeloyl-ACP methyl ester carboxylesterase